MKIYNRFCSYIKNLAPTHIRRQPQTLADKIVPQVNLPIGTFEKNILTVKKNIFGEYIFRDGKKKVGMITCCVYKQEYARPNRFPENWYIKNSAPDKNGKYPLKPFLFIEELFMKDQIDKKQLVKRKKKYGTMAMQHILQIANARGCGTRICLEADTLGQTKFKPGRFYNKIGFSLEPDIIKLYEKLEKQYYKEFAKLKQSGLSDTEIEKYLNSKSLFLPEKANGRYVADDGTMYLTNPEDLLYYPI